MGLGGLSLGLLPLGRQHITVCHILCGKIPLIKLSFSALSIYNLKSFQKTLKKSAGKPSVPGLLLFFMFLTVLPNSVVVIGPFYDWT